MKYPKDYPQRIDRIRQEYARLSEEQKKRISKAVLRGNRELFIAWSERAETRYHNHQRCAERPPGVGPKLDAALSRGPQSEFFLRSIVQEFFETDFPEWVKTITGRLSAVMAFDVESELEKIHAEPQRPFLGNEFEALFCAASRRNPGAWFRKQPEEGPKPTVAESAGDTARLAAQASEARSVRADEGGPSEVDEFAQLNSTLGLVETAVSEAKAALPFDKVAVVEALTKAARIGESLRTRIANAAASANRSIPVWTSVSEYLHELEQLNKAIESSERVTVLRNRLRSLIDTLELIVDIGTRSERRRKAIEQARVEAVAELHQRIDDQLPPALPGEGDGEAWFKAVFGLSLDGFSRHLEDLRSATLPQLAAFIEELESWDKVKVRVPENRAVGVVCDQAAQHAAQEVPAITQSIQPLRQGCEQPRQVEPASEPEAFEGGKPMCQSGLAVDAVGSEVATGIVAETARGRDGIPVDRAVGEESCSVQPPEGGFSDGQAADSVNDEMESGCIPVLLSIDAAQDLRTLLPDAVASLPADQRSMLPPQELWEVLSVHPWIVHPESETTLAAGALLGKVVESGWTANSSLCAQLAWAATVLPTFVGIGSTGLSLLAALPTARLAPEIAEFTRLTIAFLSDVPHCSPQRIASGTLRAKWQENLAQLQSDLRRFCEAASSQTINYQKATLVWRRLNSKGGHLHSIAERAQANPTPELLSRLRVDLRELANPRERSREIERTAKATLKEHYEHIDGAARAQLDNKICDFATGLGRLCEHASAEPKNLRFIEQKVAEFRRRALPSLQRYVGESAHAERLCSQNLVRQITARSARSILELFEAQIERQEPLQPHASIRKIARLRIRDLRVDPISGDLKRAERPDEHWHAFSAMRFDSVIDAFNARLKDSDIANARVLLNEIGGDESLREQFEHARSTARRDARARLKAARRDVINARTLSVIGDSDAQERLTGLAEVERLIEEVDDIREANERMSKIRRDIQELGRAEADKLEAELKKLASSDELKDRIQELLKAGDLATAREYIVRISAGHALPPLLTEDELGGFSRAVEDQIVAAFGADNGFSGYVARVKSRGKVAGCDFGKLSIDEHRDVVDWLDSWQNLRAGENLSESAVRRWLSGLRLLPRAVKISGSGRNAFADVEVEPIADRSLCAVPAFGSEVNGHYRILHFAHRQDPAQLVQHVAGSPRGTGVMLMLGYRLDRGARLEYARLCRERNARGLLVDETLMAFLSRFESGRLGRLFRATLPFTWVNPYLPTSSFVPPEMFFGRVDAIGSLLDPAAQRCFVYGGRQLGKTALLREVARRFQNSQNGTFAIWMDLQAEELGRESEPSEIWGKLARRFRDGLPGFDEFWKSTRGNEDSVRIESSIRRWLDSDPKRRILLLLDEGDCFLDGDIVADYAETRRLRALMDHTSRRLKVVFAGLHNVQRSTRLANHPLAHLGTPINIGAFSENGEWMEAYSLIVGPLAALGFYFESIDLPSRVLTACNFYPSLLQQFGLKLLDRMRRQSLREPPYLVTPDVVDAIIREDEFRKFMTDRFRWTLQLDERYHYLAYGYAFLFHTDPDRAARGFTATELREFMEQERPKEFSRLSHEEFGSLLDEMKGLGIFQCSEGEANYRLRNTNVLLLLGTPNEVYQRLGEDVRDPRSNFRSETWRGRASGNRRRILTRPEENRLFGRENKVTLVGSSPLAESASLAESLRLGAKMEHFHAISAQSPRDLGQQLRRLADDRLDEGTHLVYVNTTKANLDDDFLSIAFDFTERKTSVRFFSVVFGFPFNRGWDDYGRTLLGSDHIRCVFGRRWEEDFIAAWLQEQEVMPPDDGVREIRELTDGWPKLLHLFSDKLRDGAHWDDAFQTTRDAIEELVTNSTSLMQFLGDKSVDQNVADDFRGLHEHCPEGFTTADAGALAELNRRDPAQIMHRIDLACRLDLLERRQATYRWTRLFGDALAAR